MEPPCNRVRQLQFNADRKPHTVAPGFDRGGADRNKVELRVRLAAQRVNRAMRRPHVLLPGGGPQHTVSLTDLKPSSAASLRRWAVTLGLFLTCSGVVHADVQKAFPGVVRKWQYYQSPNFELYSANGDVASRKVLENMELLRAVFLERLKFTVRMPQPVTIFYFSRDKDFNAYLPASLRGGTAEYAGYCSSFADRTLITLSPSRDQAAARGLVYHEYVHYLFRITEQNPAPWFNEGFAELFSTMRDEGDWLFLGDPVAGSVFQLRSKKMVPFEQLFATRRDSPMWRDSGHTGIFYAQSWAFLHYCLHGVNKIPQEKSALFLRVAGSPRIQERPEDFREISKELLGLDYPELQRVMERYISTGSFRGRKVPRPEIAPRSSYESRPVEKEEITARLAELSLRVTDNAYANWYLRDQKDRAPTIRLHELFGTLAMNEGQSEVAQEHWNKAVEMGTTNAAIFRELGRLESNAVFSNFNLDYEMPVERAERLRHLLKRSIECAPAQSQGYEMLAWVEASVRTPDIANVNLVQRQFATLNDKARTVLALAVLRMRRGEKQTALKLLDDLELLEPSDWVRYCAEVTRARLEGRPVDPARLPKQKWDKPKDLLKLPDSIRLPR